ncbi:relaxase domain-containing protein [Streptomyces swartbergensis]|uniref:relaxase domain-containing protein n=1 Tax=Streptomyces swartbergensis TaxID=487165 RepID=UPI003818AC4F
MASGALHGAAESAVAASALYNELVMAEACEALGLASEPRTVTAGRRPVMEVAGVPHELIRWTARRGERIAACLTGLEHEYVTATDEDGNLKFAPVVSERARAKLNRIAARKTHPAKPAARSLVQLREDWRKSARDFLAAGADLIDSLLERARAAAAAIRARSPPWSTSPWRPSPPPATAFVMNKDGCFHRRHLLAEARRHLALVQRGRRREPCLDEKIVDTALAAHCTDITEARTERGEEPGYRLYTARWAPAAPPRSRTPAAAVSGRDRKSTAPAAPFVPLKPAEWAIPRVPLRNVPRRRRQCRAHRPAAYRAPHWPPPARHGRAHADHASRAAAPLRPGAAARRGPPGGRRRGSAHRPGGLGADRRTARLPQPRRAAPRRAAQGLQPACAPGRRWQCIECAGGSRCAPGRGWRGARTAKTSSAHTDRTSPAPARAPARQ